MKIKATEYFKTKIPAETRDVISFPTLMLPKGRFLTPRDWSDNVELLDQSGVWRNPHSELTSGEVIPHPFYFTAGSLTDLANNVRHKYKECGANLVLTYREPDDLNIIGGGKFCAWSVAFARSRDNVLNVG